jgi:hypothetical protein
LVAHNLDGYLSSPAVFNVLRTHDARKHASPEVRMDMIPPFVEKLAENDAVIPL